MILATAAEMREIDRIAISELGVPGGFLMERAGTEVAAALVEEFGPVEGKPLLIVAGPGNNGGDGFVVARRLQEARAATRVILVGSREAVRGDAREALARADAAGVPVVDFPGPPHGDGAGGEAAAVEEAVGRAVAEMASGSAVVVDALLGTGASGPPRGAIARAIAALRDFPRPVVAIDIPSGVDATTGAVPGSAVRATVTVSLGLGKPGLYLYPGRDHAGNVRVADIGLPAEAVARVATKTRLFDPGALRLPYRAPDAHKRQAGRVLVVGGSPGLSGSVCLAGMAALRSGAGVVTLAVPRTVEPLVASRTLELMTVGLAETKARLLGTPAAEEVLALAEGFDVLAVGPGLGRGAETRGFLATIVAGRRGPLLLDADGLWMLADGLAALADAPAVEAGGVVVTPHLGEAERLTGIARERIAADRVAFVREAATRMAGTFLLKGNPTLVAGPTDEVTFNSSGGPALATAGTGDVLTGLVAALWAQGMVGPEAARAGAYLHGRAGDLAAAARGWRSVIASDVIGHLPAAIRELDGAA